MIEFVWVVPREAIFLRQSPQGFSPFSRDEESGRRLIATAREEGFFMERRYAETHPAYKQVIPYVVLRSADELLCLTRLETQGESRLHGLRSIGVGGHINPCDLEGEHDDLLENACMRELHEELVLPPQHHEPVPMGILNDDTTEVGAVHLGIAFILEVAGAAVSVRETSAMAGGFEPLAALQAAAKQDHSLFESWSTLLLSGTWEQDSRIRGVRRTVAEGIPSS